MNAFKTIICGALLAAPAISGPASAKDAPGAATWQWSQSGDGNFDVVWYTPTGRTPHGGGVARLVGGGDNFTILYADTPRLIQAPAVASLMGGGDDFNISYTASGSSGKTLVGASAGSGQPG